MKHKTWEECSKLQKIERWENVVRVLQGLTPHEKRKHFNMGVWGDKTACGTVACAAGHCALDPWFRRRGLKLVFIPYEGSVYNEDTGNFETSTSYDACLRFGSKHDFDYPVDAFFGKRGTHRIFLNTKARSVGVVVKEVKQFIRDLKNMPADEVNYLTAASDAWYEDNA